MQSWMPAGARVASNGAASTSTATPKFNGSQATPSVAATEQRFQAAVGRESPQVAQVALDPAATPLLDLNAATFQGDDPNRIRLRDLILNDGELPTPRGRCTEILCRHATVSFGAQWHYSSLGSPFTVSPSQHTCLLNTGLLCISRLIFKSFMLYTSKTVAKEQLHGVQAARPASSAHTFQGGPPGLPKMTYPSWCTFRALTARAWQLRGSSHTWQTPSTSTRSASPRRTGRPLRLWSS